jgi:GT2 family glycosyltransferase
MPDDNKSLDLRNAKTLIITVNYKRPESTLDLLESMSNLSGFAAADVIIVDNASADGSAARISQRISSLANVSLLESQTNRGYFGGANWALHHYLARKPMPGWIMVCNNDILFQDSNFLSNVFQRDPSTAAVLAPAVIARLTGVDANPFLRRRPSHWQMQRYKLWLSHYYLTWFKQWLAPYVRILRHHVKEWRSGVTKPVPTSIYAPHGAFIIFSRAFFDAGGTIDDGFFLYAEEFCVGETCYRLGLPVIHDPDLRVWHNAHQTTGRMLTRPTYNHQRQGFIYALRKYNLPALDSPGDRRTLLMAPDREDAP